MEEHTVANRGRAKRKSAQSAQDALLARTLQQEIWNGLRGKKPKCEELGIDLKAEKKRGASSGGGAASTDDCTTLSGRKVNLRKSEAEKQEGGAKMLKHCVGKNSLGFLEADARRGCSRTGSVCDVCVQQLAHEITKGSGIVVIRGAISKEAAAKARKAINKLTLAEEKRGTSLEGELGPSHRRIFNLLNEGPPFTNLITHTLIFNVLSRVIGSDFTLGSFSANEIGAKCPQGPAHVDYPYSMLESFPSDPLACQAIFCLDEWTQARGATRVKLHSQKQKEHPDKDDELETVVEGQPGDLVMYNSLLHHRSGPNSTQTSRIGLLVQFLAKYVRPMEDQVRGVKAQVKKGADKRLRQLLALDCPFSTAGT